MNIEDFNNRIFKNAGFREGEHVDYIIQSIEKQKIANLEPKNINEITTQIKF